MWKSKGIETILRSVPYLPSGVKIDLFGPLDEYMAEDINCRGSQCVRYRGILTQREVMTRLWDYDALVLPTSHAGEGYPGVILEAFSHGLPVITTRWMSIPEIVDESCGILIETESVEEFVAAVTRLHSDPMLFARLGEGARNKSQQFDSTWWTEQFIRFCDRAISKRKVSAA
jgi:glycosyltransferase involved in cell wall biosynthesis